MHKPQQLLHLPHEQGNKDKKAPKESNPIPSGFYQDLRKKRRGRPGKSFSQCLLKDQFTKERKLLLVFSKGSGNLTVTLTLSPSEK